jgi:hypothetical protein
VEGEGVFHKQATKQPVNSQANFLCKVKKQPETSSPNQFYFQQDFGRDERGKPCQKMTNEGDKRGPLIQHLLCAKFNFCLDYATKPIS